MILLSKTISKIALVALVLLTVICTVSASNAGPSSIDFTDETFERAKKRASSEGRLFFVDFYADWCTPCKWMENTTFQDKEVANMLNNNYVSIKVDIDTKDGFDVKQKYQIRVLPTLLIFNTEGELVERVEETLSRSKLMNLLNFHVHKDAKVITNHYFNQSPNDTAPVTNPAPAMDSQYDNYRNKTVKSSYRVQLGDYDNYEAALRKVNELRDQFLEEIIVLNDYRDGKVWYRVLMGRFGSENEATSFKNILMKNHNLPAIVY